MQSSSGLAPAADGPGTRRASPARPGQELTRPRAVGWLASLEPSLRFAEGGYDRSASAGTAAGQAKAAHLLGRVARSGGHDGASGSLLSASAGPAVGYRHRGAPADWPAGLRRPDGMAGQGDRRRALPGDAGIR